MSYAAHFMFPFFYTAIATAAMEMLGGEESIRASRKPEIMADAAYCILTSDKSLTGQFLIDDAVLKQHGISNLDQYANVPGINSLLNTFVFYCHVCSHFWYRRTTFT